MKNIRAKLSKLIGELTDVVVDLLGFNLIKRALGKYRCPRCNYPVYKTESSCPNCGQKIKTT